MIELKKLKDLVRLMKENDLTELDLQGEGERVTLKRATAQPAVQYVTAAPAMSPQPFAQASQPSPGPSAEAGSPARREEEGLTPIASPMVGTFYAAPSPDAGAYVNVGDRVTPDTVVCIIEAMKVFNEIKAEAGGTVVKVLVTNGQAVEFGQPLFLIKPS